MLKNKYMPTEIKGVILIEPRLYEDDRGFFYESYNYDEFCLGGISDIFVQDNHSKSRKGTLRGLHYQIDPSAQSKLIRVSRGRIWDVAVDLRAGSETFGRWVGRELSEQNKNMFYIPVGCAHGFLALEEHTEVIYKASNSYSPEHEKGLLWNDPTLKIDWPSIDGGYLISPKDEKNPSFDRHTLH